MRPRAQRPDEGVLRDGEGKLHADEPVLTIARDPKRGRHSDHQIRLAELGAWGKAGRLGFPTRVASAGHSMASEAQHQDLAWNLLKSLATKEAYQAFYDIDHLPVSSKSVREAAAKNQGSTPPAHVQFGIDALSYARPERVVGNWSSIHSTLANALQGVWGPENKNVQTLLTSVAGQINDLIKTKPTATK